MCVGTHARKNDPSATLIKKNTYSSILKASKLGKLSKPGKLSRLSKKLSKLDKLRKLSKPRS